MTIKIINKNIFNEMPAAILFDTDNTLYEYTPAHNAALDATIRKAYQLFGTSEQDFKQVFNKARNEIHDRLKGTASSHSRLLYFQRVLELMGLGSQVLLALDLEQTYWRTFLTNAVLFENVLELLQDVRAMRIPTAIVTDLTAQIQFRKIVYFGLDHYFDYIVTSEEAGFDKPHRGPFEIALEKINVVNQNVWFVGDNPINDIQGAKSSIQAVTLQKIHAGINPEQTADAHFNDFSQIRQLLSSLVK